MFACAGDSLVDRWAPSLPSRAKRPQPRVVGKDSPSGCRRGRIGALEMVWVAVLLRPVCQAEPCAEIPAPFAVPATKPAFPHPLFWWIHTCVGVGALRASKCPPCLGLPLSCRLRWWVNRVPRAIHRGEAGVERWRRPDMPRFRPLGGSNLLAGEWSSGGRAARWGGPVGRQGAPVRLRERVSRRGAAMRRLA